MKRKFLIVSALLFSWAILNAQKTPYNVVFDLTGNDSTVQVSVLRWVDEILKTNPDANLEVVMYGQGINLVVRGRAYKPEVIEKLATKTNVVFAVCEIALKNHNLGKADLLTGIRVVPDGIYEIISKQASGWGYIKVAH
jgi:uncharacterized protein